MDQAQHRTRVRGQPQKRDTLIEKMTERDRDRDHEREDTKQDRYRQKQRQRERQGQGQRDRLRYSKIMRDRESEIKGEIQR